MTGAPVSATATQASDLRARWAWVEPAVWTDRMLSALEEGVKGDVWFSLIDKVYRPKNLAAAARKVIANKGAPGVDNVTVQQYERFQDEYLPRLSESLREDTWRPKAIKRRYIPKPGSAEQRPLGIPCGWSRPHCATSSSRYSSESSTRTALDFDRGVVARMRCA